MEAAVATYLVEEPARPVSPRQAPPPRRRLLLWIYDLAYYEKMMALMAKVSPIADVVPVSRIEEAASMLELNSSFDFLITPGGQWLHGSISVLRSKRPNVPVVVFENYDHFMQRKCVEAGAAFVAPHVDILKDYLLKHSPASPRAAPPAAAAGSPAVLPPPFNPYRAQRSPTIGEHVMWPQIGSVVYSEATKIKYPYVGLIAAVEWAYTTLTNAEITQMVQRIHEQASKTAFSTASPLFRDSMEVWTELCRVQQLMSASPQQQPLQQLPGHQLIPAVVCEGPLQPAAPSDMDTTSASSSPSDDSKEEATKEDAANNNTTDEPEREAKKARPGNAAEGDIKSA